MKRFEKKDEPLDPAAVAEIVQYAKSLGPSNVRCLRASEIPVDPKLAEFCADGRCPGYGQSMSCPPNVIRPDEFIKALETFSHGVVFKFDVPTALLLGDDRFQISRMVHETVAAIEVFSLGNGCRRVAGYAAGSCKRIFCAEHVDCQVLKDGVCRHPEYARPSMSGMGVHFFDLCKKLGWQIDKITKENRPADAATGTMAGLVLIG